MNFLEKKILSFGIDYIKNNPETIDKYCGLLLNACENAHPNSVILFFKNKLGQPQISIASVNKTDNRIVQIHNSYTSKNLFELLKMQKND